MKHKVDLKELAARESEQVEWKENVADAEDVLKSIAAFANDFQNLGGGYVVCGAKESKDEHDFQKVSYPGLSASRLRELEFKVLNDARSKIDPAVTPLVEELPAERGDARVLVFIVASTGSAHSYRASGKDSAAYYVRIGRQTIEARNGVLRELLVRTRALDPWDRRLNEDARLEDIDLLAFRDVMQKIETWNPAIAIEEYFSEVRISEFVPTLGGKRPLAQLLHPRNFAILLFAAEPTRFFPGAWTKVSVYPGKDRSERTAERHDLTGSVVSQSMKALNLLKTHTSTVYDKESEAPNAPKYPERALQEAIINAIAHRDYELDEPTSITVFSDRIEIRSPGGLPRTIDKEKFLAGRAPPSWRNQSLAYFFNKLQLAQAEGQGIPTIIRTMQQLGSPSPVFETDDYSVTCVLPAHPRHELIRHVAEIERLTLQQDYEDAQEKLDAILKTNSKNPKLLDLLSQLAALRQRPEAIGNYVVQHDLQPQDLHAGTAFQFADLLSQSPEPQHQSLGLTWLDYVSRQSLASEEVKRVALALRKIGKDEQAVQIISTLISHSTSPLSIPPILYDIRARAKIDLAKRCMDTGRDYKAQPERRARAWDLCRRYLEEAEGDIIRAIDSETKPREREYYENDLEFVRKLRQQVRKPEQQLTSRKPTMRHPNKPSQRDRKP